MGSLVFNWWYAYLLMVPMMLGVATVLVRGIR